jgi:hypothetical protein
MSKLRLAGVVLWALALVTTVAAAEDLTVREIDTTAAASPATSNAVAPPIPPATVPPDPSSKTRSSKSFNIDLKVDGNGFKLGSHISGENGVSGAWLGTHLRGNGATVEAGVQGNEGPSRDVRLNLDLLPGWAATAVGLWLLFH